MKTHILFAPAAPLLQPHSNTESSTARTNQGNNTACWTLSPPLVWTALFGPTVPSYTPTGVSYRSPQPASPPPLPPCSHPPPHRYPLPLRLVLIEFISFVIVSHQKSIKASYIVIWQVVWLLNDLLIIHVMFCFVKIV